MRCISALFLVVLLAPAIAQGQYPGADAITAAQLRDYLAFIASDELEGRNTPSRGLNTAAKFIATHLSRWGFKPGGDKGSYFQKIELRKTTIDAAKTTLALNGHPMEFGKDFTASVISGGASGKMVYVGHGYVVKRLGLDSFKDLDVKGKIIVKLSGLPPGMTFADFRGKMGEDWEGSVSYGARNGALAVVVVPDYQALSQWDNVVQQSTVRGSYAVEAFMENDEPSIPVVTLSLRATQQMFQGERLSGQDAFKAAVNRDSTEGFDFKGDKVLSLNVHVRKEQEWTQNVIGILEGSDNSLKNEYLAVGAHYDHVGIGAPMEGDSIWNGADDDGSGTVAVLAMAETAAKSTRPKRSVLFIWHAGEEKGLWGSRYFVEHPTVPLKSIVTQLNIDMIGRSKSSGDTHPRNRELSGPEEIYVIGSKMLSSELGELSERVNRSYLKLAFNYQYDDPNDPNRFFYRSDHFNYAKKGIPIIFYFDGEHEDYHGRGDHWDKIDYMKMEKVTRTVYATGWEIANGSDRPAVDKELPIGLNQ